ncbi:MAG: hypothetical protein RJA49_498, partial [Actinomycetota bacterium]
ITLGPGLPESRGWPTPPFPEPDGQTVTTWVNLALGATGPTVAKVQAALDAKGGATIGVDGKFGSQTFTAVKAFQIAKGLKPAALGTVDKATADLLGVQRMTGGTFPPKGWTWLGWGYNGASALARWEAMFVSNTKPIGAIRAGGLRAMPDALPLFVGFYTEIQARGYIIHDGGTYVFRCTASTRKDCAGLGRYALSNHAYGLASDINTALNPMKRYVSSGTSSACSVPVTTDMPRWVIQTAEKWGLYWGGYAWSSGCQSPTTWRTSVTRDPMHFEFNGSPAQARAILKRVSSMTCIDVVSTGGATSLKCLQPGEMPAAGTRIAVTTTPPAGATAALVVLSTLGATVPGTVTVEDCAARPAGSRTWTNAAVRPGRLNAATTMVPIDAKGRFCLTQSAAFHTVVTVQGYFVPSAAAPTGNLFTPVPPVHAVDSSAQTFCTPTSTCSPPGPVPAGTEVMSTVATSLTPVAALAHVTVDAPAAAGTLRLGTCSNQPPSIVGSNTLVFTGLDGAETGVGLVGLSMTDLGAQFCTTATRAAQQRVDVTGFFAPAAGGGLGYTAQVPVRVADTRQCWVDGLTLVQRCNRLLGVGNTVRLKAPTGAAVVLLDVTAIGVPTSKGALTAASCATIGVAGATAPAVQVLPSTTTSNMVAVPVAANGTYCVRTNTVTHLSIDVLGTFSATGDLRYVPVSAVRPLDTRRKT